MNAAVKQPVTGAKVDPYVVTLSKDLVTHSGPIRQFRLREPNAGDFVSINALPFTVVGDPDENGQGGELKFDFAVGMKWLVALSDIGQVELEKMGKFDFLRALGQVAQVVILDGADPKN